MAVGQGPLGPNQPRVSVSGSFQTELVPVTEVDNFVTKQGRVNRARGATIFFSAAALGTAPALAPADTPMWVVLLLAGEGAAAVASGITWAVRRRPAREARQALGGGNRIVYTVDYGGFAVAPQPPDKREGTRREGPTPGISEER